MKNLQKRQIPDSVCGSLSASDPRESASFSTFLAASLPGPGHSAGVTPYRHALSSCVSPKHIAIKRPGSVDQLGNQMTHEINIPVEAAPEATYRPRFTGALAEIESELASSASKGDANWCNTFRDIHDGDLAERAPIDMLQEFANEAPSPLLRGYVLGIMFARERRKPLGMSPVQWAAKAMTVDDPVIRGMALADAFMAVMAATRKPEPLFARPTERVNSKRRRRLRNPS